MKKIMLSGKRRLHSVSGRHPTFSEEAHGAFYRVRSLPIFTDISRRLPRVLYPCYTNVSTFTEPVYAETENGSMQGQEGTIRGALKHAIKNRNMHFMVSSLF